MRFPLSEKYKDFMRQQARAEFLEGSTFSGKTTVGAVKFILKVMESAQPQHVIAGLNLGTIEKNILNSDMGILDVFKGRVEYFPSGHGQHNHPHLSIGDKVIYLLGYDNKSRWKNALGGQYGCVMIDEINIAEIDFIREITMRSDYLLATLNPDSPNLPVYKEYINHARPCEKYAADAPGELLQMLDQPAKEGWIWWYFTFDHNASLTEAKRQSIINSVPMGTKLYKNKIQGLRGKATGLVFSNFDRAKHVISANELKRRMALPRNDIERIEFELLTAGLDTSYSSKSPDTISMSYCGITRKGVLVVLDERAYNNARLSVPLAPSDTINNLVAFMDRNTREWGFTRNIWIDSADQATITEAKKYNRNNTPLYTFNPAWKKMQIIDRVNLQLGWFQHGQVLIADTCTNYINELETYSWDESKDSTPEDGNDHMINSVQYAWLPYKQKIGVQTK